MIITVSTHHACTHWQSQSKFLCCFCVHFPHLRMICQPQIIIQAPYYHFFSTKLHTTTNSTFQFWKSKIAMSSVTMLSYRTVMFYKTFKNICHIILDLYPEPAGSHLQYTT